MVADDDSSPEVTLCKQQAAYKFHLCHCYTDQVRCDWWRSGHVITVVTSDWSRVPASTSTYSSLLAAPRQGFLRSLSSTSFRRPLPDHLKVKCSYITQHLGMLIS